MALILFQFKFLVSFLGSFVTFRDECWLLGKVKLSLEAGANILFLVIFMIIWTQVHSLFL